MCKLSAFLLAVISILDLAQCLSILGPRVLRPFSNYKVSVSGGSRAINLYVAIEGRRVNGEQFSQGRVVQVQEASSRLIELEIGDPGPGQYKLVARSTSGPLFSSTAPLVYQPRSFCIFIQTDRKVYQPGDTITFRVIALNKYLLPLSSSVDVSILDTGGSAVRQWASEPLDKGLFSGEFVLADEPALGEWTIEVEVNGQKYSKRITVADYVLPNFDMKMEMPKELLFSDGRFNINVTAKHFNGLPVRGELTISAYAVFFSNLLQPVFSSPARKVVEFNGQADIVYDLKTDLDLAEDAARPLVIEAILEEKDTLIRQNISSRILLLRAPYRLRVAAPDYFKPTLPYNVQIEVVNSAGDITEESGEVTVERLWDDGAPVNVTTLALKNGVATYSYTPDLAHTNSTLNIVVKYKDISERVANVQKSDGTEDQYLTIELLTNGLNKNGDIRARVTATEPMDLLHYVVIGRGDILVANTLELRPARRSVDVSVAGAAGAAGGALAAWYPRLPSDALVAAALLLPRADILHHKVSLSTTVPRSVRPNGIVQFQVSGEPGARAALLGLDQNAIVNGLANENGLGNGLDMNTIEREVESFSGLSYSIFKSDDHVPGQGMDLGGYSTSDVFKAIGVVILTDGLVPENSKTQGVEAVVETGTRGPQAGPFAFSRLPTPPAPRRYLTRPLAAAAAFLAANLTLGNNSSGILDHWSPITPGEWIVGAFAIHPTLGLGIAPPQKFETLLPLSMTSELPEELRKGESIAVVITLKSTLTVDTDVEVTFHNTDQYFEFELLENNVDSPKKIETYKRLQVKVPASGIASTAFLVSAVRVGDAPVIVEARGNGVSASLFRNIHIKDGYEEEIWSWALLDARRGVSRANVSLSPAAGARLSGVSLQAAGDLLAAALHSLADPPRAAVDPVYAIRPLAQACVLLDYLQVTDQLDEVATSSRARALASAGYQRLAAFRRADGAFSQEPRGPPDVWMTATAARWSSRCARYVQVSGGAAAGAARWLAAAQRPDGSWRRDPPAHDPRTNHPLPLTAHALLALLETKGSETLYKNGINKALAFLVNNVSPEADAFSLAIVGYTLAAARHPQAADVIQMMDKYANTTGVGVFWSRSVPASEWRNPWLRDNSAEAATSAWALRALLALRRELPAAAAAHALLPAAAAPNPDPEVLDAIAQFAESVKTPTKLRVSVNVTGFDEPRQFTIDSDNALILQTQLIRAATTAFAQTSGRGVCALGMRAKTSSRVTSAWPRYTLDPRVDRVSSASRLQLSVCYGFVPVGNETESGLVLITIQLPSGYVADIHTITELASLTHVVGARARGASTVVAWARAAREERCVTLAAPRALPVAAQRPAAVTLIDLYDSSHRARTFYQVVPATSCDVCRAWESCARACGAAAGQRAPLPADRPAPAPDTAPAPALAPALTVAAAILAVYPFQYIYLLN